MGIIADIFLVITASVASLQRAGSRITAFAYIYNAVTILVAVLLSLPIARTTERQEKKEADGLETFELPSAARGRPIRN